MSYNNLMKLLLFSIFLWHSSFTSANNKEVETYLMGMKEKKDEQMLLNSQIFQDCKKDLQSFQKDTEAKDSSKKSYLEKLEKCVATKITQNNSGGLSEKKIKELAKSLDLASYNKKASQNAKSIQEYLSNRIHKAIYGETKLSDSEIEKIKKAKLVNHELFYQMYSEQIGKNVLLTTANYCLENFGYKSPENFIYPEAKKDSNDKDFILISSTSSLISKKADATDETLYTDAYDLNNTLLEQFNQTQDKSRLKLSSIADIWGDTDNLYEYEVCSATNKKRCDERFSDTNNKVKPYRPQRIITLLKDAEFQLARGDVDKNLIKDKYNFCVLQVIPNMCEIYKCSNSYDQNSPDAIKKNCVDMYNITPKQVSTNPEDLSLDTKNKKGYIACNVMARLEEYRLILKGVKDIQKENTNFLANKPMVGIGAGENKVFNKSGEINKILTVSSKEMKKIDSIKNGKEDALALREECLDEENPGNEIDGFVFKQGATENPKCAPLLAKTNKAEFETVVLDTEAKTKLLEKSLEDLNSEEAITKYLEEAGLYDKYKDKLDSLTPEEMKSLVMADFKNQKQALIDSLAAKFNQDKKIKVTSDQEALESNKEVENEIATQTFEDMQNYQERVDTLFEYTNVVSSYLEMENKDTKEKVRNTATLQVEAEYASDETNEIIQEYYEEGDASSSSAEVGYDTFLDTILGYNEKESDSKK